MEKQENEIIKIGEEIKELEIRYTKTKEENEKLKEKLSPSRKLS